LHNVESINAGPQANVIWVPPPYLQYVQGAIYFIPDDPSTGRELWRSDGTQAGATLVKDILPGDVGSAPRLSAQAGMLYLAANDGVHGIEPWVSDGTEGGTFLMSDANPGQASSKPDRFT
jgi:ELWxxDGT repeat protein